MSSKNRAGLDQTIFMFMFVNIMFLFCIINASFDTVVQNTDSFGRAFSEEKA